MYLLIRFQKPIELTDRKSNLSESETSKSLNRNQSVESSSKEDLLASYSSVHSAATGREQGMVALLMRTKTETMESRSSSMSINSEQGKARVDSIRSQKSDKSGKSEKTEPPPSKGKRKKPMSITMRRWIDNDAELNAALYMQYMPDDVKQIIFNDERVAR